MTAEPRDVEEIRGLCDACEANMEAPMCEECYTRLGPVMAANAARDAALDRLAAADRENAELRGEVERLRESQFAVGQALVNEQLDSDRARAQLAAAQAQLAEAREVGDLNGQEADNLLARAEAAEARLEAVRALCANARQVLWPSANGYDSGWTLDPAAVLAALSAAPQPEPELGSAAYWKAECHKWIDARVRQDARLFALIELWESAEEVYEWNPLAELRAAMSPEPPASDEPARCVHGWTRRHVMVSSQSTSVAGLPDATTCPGPTAPTPTPECRHCNGSGNAHTFDGDDVGICGTCHGTGSAAGGGL